MVCKIITEPPAMYAPAAVAWLAQILGHEEAPEVLAEHDCNLPMMPDRYGHLVAAEKAVEGAEPPELMPRRSFRPVAEEALARERSMLGDASDLVRGSRGRSPRDTPGRIDLSEEAV
jgi:hypothetical protein